MILYLTDKSTSFALYVCIYIYIRERKCSRAIMRLAQQFPDDPGAMAPLFLNYLLIAPGESFFMAGKTLFTLYLVWGLITNVEWIVLRRPFHFSILICC